MDDTLTGSTSETLLGRVCRSPNDRSAWDRFVARYAPQIDGWCRRWGLQDADAADVTQAVLVQLATKLRGFVYDPSRSFRGWLRTLARHAWSDHFSETRRGAVGAGGVAGSDALAVLDTLPARDDLERRLAEAFDLEVLELATNRVRQRVAPHTWQAFHLTAVEGMSGAEVAARLDMPVVSVFKAKSNVQKLLRAEISALEGEAPG